MEKNENGFSDYNFGRSTNGRNATCPGTGEKWTPNVNGGMGGEISGVGDNENNGAPCPGAGLGGERQLAMVYSPYQCWRMIYSPDKALMRGTLFEELDKPLEECGNG